MPIFEFKCLKCGRVVEKLYSSFDAMNTETTWQCDPPRCTGFLERQPAAPSFHVRGFNQMTGYASEQTRVQRHKNGITTTTKGNFEAFDGIVNS